MKYTLDRFEEGFAVFLKSPEEVEQLIINKQELQLELNEGDIVDIVEAEGHYSIRKLEQETSNQKKKIENLIKKLTEKNIGES